MWVRLWWRRGRVGGVHYPTTRDQEQPRRPRTLLLGVDRLDHTKGIEQRLEVYGRLLKQGELVASDSVFVQVGVPTRERVAQYAGLRERIDRLTGRLTDMFSGVGRQVVQYTNQQYGFDDMVALYTTADIMMITPLSDGMNLVAKEYVASRIDHRGVLVLSEFAVAAAELDEALLVNPNDVDELANAILLAATMDPGEQRRRMELMRSRIHHHDIHAWASSFLDTLRTTTRQVDKR
jgi:trehalose 6-phosphate synthase